MLINSGIKKKAVSVADGLSATDTVFLLRKELKPWGVAPNPTGGSAPRPQNCDTIKLLPILGSRGHCPGGMGEQHRRLR